MNLGQFAVAVGAPTRWVQNALQALSLPAEYTADLARRLSFARMLKSVCGMPLRQGFPLAGDALARWPADRCWELASSDTAAKITVDLERFLSDFHIRLSLSKTRFAGKHRGRPPKRRRRGLNLAKWYGVDLSLLQMNLQLTVEQRLRGLDEMVEQLKRLQVARR
jgi:hypothetical protein